MHFHWHTELAQDHNCAFPWVGTVDMHLGEEVAHLFFPTMHTSADVLSEHGPDSLVAWNQTGIPTENCNKCKKENLSIWKHLFRSYCWSTALYYSGREKTGLCF